MSVGVKVRRVHARLKEKDNYALIEWYSQLPDTGPVLDIIHQQDEDMEREKMRNRYPQLLCARLIHKITSGSDSPQKPVSTPSVHKDVGITRSALYCFKVVVNDGKTTTPITCFSDQPNTLTRDVNEVLAELAYKDPYTLPPFLKQPEGVTHTFQFYFDTMVTARRPDLVLDKVFPNPTLALPPPMTTSSANNSVFRGFFEKQKLTGPNFIDWYRQLKIVLSIEDKLNYLEQLIPPAPNYNMHSMGKTVNELHAMLKLHEQTLPKTTLLLFMLRADKVQKVNKHKKSQSQMATRGQNHGKGKNKQAYAPKPKIPPPPKREDPANDSICHECGETGHWKRNCPRYLAELLKKKKNAASGAGGLEQELLQTTRDFHSCRQEERQSVSLYVLKMKGYIDNLERLGYPVTFGLGVSLILIGLRKEYDGFVQNYNMHSMGNTFNELHAMLKLHEQSLPKNNAPALNAIRAGKVQKGNKHKKLQSQMAARGQNREKGKNKQAYAPKPKIPPLPKRENPAKDLICHECGEIGHWKRNCPQYLTELLKKKKNAASGACGSCIFVIELNTILYRSWIYDTGCGTHSCNTMQGLRASRKLKLYVVSNKRAKLDLDSALLWH
nr:zinc finger, CCHC-type [Tanacetum cinerariifolium]